MAHDFTGKVAFVTGAASGIGAAVARQLAQGGAKVVVADLNKDKAQSVVDAITKAGGTATAYGIDVVKPEAVEAAIKFTVDTYGGLHLAVNNAGIGGAANPTGEYRIEDWQKVIDINLNSVFYSLRYELPAILASGGGAIVNMASILGTNGFANAPAYVAAKHGVVGLTKTSAIEYAAKVIPSCSTRCRRFSSTCGCAISSRSRASSTGIEYSYSARTRPVARPLSVSTARSSS